MVLARTPLLSLALALGSLVAALVGCGGDAASGGAGGDAGSGGSSTSSSSTGGGVLACVDLCHKLDTNSCGAAPQDCAAFCQGQFADAGICAEELDALYACWLPVSPACPTKPPPECKAEEDTYEACVAVYGCEPAECTGSSGPDGAAECGCSQVCATKLYATACSTDATKSSCECFIDGVSIGTCEGGADVPCGINTGCCAGLFKK